MSFQEHIKILLPIEELLSIYHYVPKILLKFSKKVSVTEDSFASSNKSSIIFAEARNGNYLVIATENVNQSWLLPRVKLRINEFEYQTVTSLFDCREYQSGAVNKFIVKKPAIVSLTINGRDWKLEQRGILEFSLTSAPSPESMELEQTEEENQELRAELSELDSQLTKIKEEKEQLTSRFNQSEEERKQLLSSVEQLAKTHQASLVQLATWDTLFQQMLGVLEERKPISSQIQESEQGFIVLKNRVDVIKESLKEIHTNIPFTDEEPEPPASVQPGNQEEEPHNPIIKLIEDYNSNPNSIVQNAIEVKEGEDTNYLLHVGFPIVMIKVNQNQGFCLVLNINNSYYLVPKYDLKLNNDNYSVLNCFFIFHDYRQKYYQRFKLIKPAALVSIEKEKSWRLKEKGELQFMPSP